jgi:GAF domain-containing protein
LTAVGSEERIAEEQASLRRVATLVARAAPPEEVFATVTAEVGCVLSADVTALSRYDPDGTATVVAGWSAPVTPPVSPRSAPGWHWAAGT